jgi:hypothetical protein
LNTVNNKFFKNGIRSEKTEGHVFNLQAATVQRAFRPNEHKWLSPKEKPMKLVTLIETTLGPLEVETETVRWIWTILTFGLFKKAVCRIRGLVPERFHRLQVRAAEKWNSDLPPKAAWADKEYVFHTMRVRFWHEHMVEYVQAQGGAISDHHRFLQLWQQIDEAVQSGDENRALELLQEEADRSAAQLRAWRRWHQQGGF